MSENNFSDLFRQIENTVQDITSLNTAELKHTIDETVREVKRAVQNTAKQYTAPRTNTNSAPPPPSSHVSTPPPTNNHTAYHPASYTEEVQRRTEAEKAARQKKKLPAIPISLALPPAKVPGRVSGILLTVAGIVGAIFSAITAVFMLLFSVLTTGNFLSLIFPMLFLMGFCILAGRGISLCGRADRYAQYYRELSGVMFCSIKTLAQQTKKSVSFVAKDLQKMIDSSFFHEAHIDAKKTTFMLDNATYHHYLQLTERANAEKEQAKKRAENPELDATIREGMACIQKIKEANDAIPGEIISAKLFRLENVVTRIFQFMEKHPERLSEIRRFTSYYLPTTLKLVAAYREFDAHEIQGETVQAAKKEIEDTLDIINRSFETMYDNLFEQDARDLSADISVLHNMLKQEGLESDGISGAANK